MSWEFHALVAQAAHNAAVEGITTSFRSTLSMHPIRTREGTQSHARTVEEHARILDAIERRDGATARREMAHHLLRGTNLEKRESALLALWDADGSRQRSSRRAK
jgi:DNA-binding FadR family transcriptional regulator